MVADGDARRARWMLARSVPAAGRSRAWVDGRMAPVSALAEAAAELVDIHGQHEHQPLVTAAGPAPRPRRFRRHRPRAVARCGSRLRIARRRARRRSGGDAHQRAREIDVLRHQVAEIAAASLDDPDEEAALRREEERLADPAAYREAAPGALPGPRARPAGEGGALDLLGHGSGRAGGPGGLRGAPRPAARAAAELADVASSLRDGWRRWRTTRGGWTRSRIAGACWRDLRRKYGGDLAAVVAFGAEAAARLACSSDAEGEAARLQAEREAAAAELAEAEAAVRAGGPAPPAPSAGRWGTGWATLAMAGARFEVAVAPTGTGEPVQLLSAPTWARPCCPWPGPPRAASWPGRCWRSAWSPWAAPRPWSSTRSTPASAAPPRWRSARRCRRWRADRQVLVVTHLAQVAALADRRSAWSRHARRGRTVTSATAVEGEDASSSSRGCSRATPAATPPAAHAEELLGASGATARQSTTGRAAVDYRGRVRRSSDAPASARLKAA